MSDDRGIGLKGWLSGQKPQVKGPEAKPEPVILDRHRIAVLPFSNISPDPKDEYFADGLTEELIARLSLLKGMEVIARTTTMIYKRKEKSASQIGRELRAGTLLEGSVRKAANRIRVTAQLIDSNTEGHLWADSFDGDLEDVFTVQRAIAEKVASALELKPLATERERIRRREPTRPDAYVEYLRGLHLLGKFSEDSIRNAIHHFEKAVELEPNYSAAMAQLSVCYTDLGYLTVEPRNRAYSRAKEFASKAIRLDETNSEAHVSMAYAAFFDCDWPRAEVEVRQALQINPSFVDAHIFNAIFLQNFGSIDQAVSEIRRVLELDPVSFIGQIVAGDVFLMAGMISEAMTHFENALEMDPQSAIAHCEFGKGLVLTGRTEEGVREVERASALSGGSPFYKGNLGWVYAETGRNEDALRIVDELKQDSNKVPETAYSIAAIYARLEEKEGALDWLETAYREHAIAVTPLFTTIPTFAFLRKEPRFKDLVKKLGLDKYHIA